MIPTRSLAGIVLLAGTSFGQVTERVSVGNGGVQGNATAWSANFGRPFSADCRFVVFGSQASNLVAGDANALPDVFVRDRMTGTTELISVSSTGAQGDNWSGLSDMAISSDGRMVAFFSVATNLVPGDANATGDVFVRDRSNGTTERVSVSSLGIEGNASSSGPSLSSDGRYVAFFSAATNLVGGDLNQTSDCFVRDRLTGTTERVSVDSSGVEANDLSSYPSISADGRFVAFTSMASNLFSGDTNATRDVFVHDRLTGTTVIASVDSAGILGLGSSTSAGISSDGRWVTFESTAPNLVPSDTNNQADAFIHDMLTGLTERVSVSSNGAEGDGLSKPLGVSDDGRYVGITSTSTNLVAGDTNGVWDGFVRDRITGITERVSVASDGSQGHGGSSAGWLTPDGRYVQMDSLAYNLVPGDTNGVRDQFIRDRFAAGFTGICDPGVGGVIACPCGNAPAGSGRGCDNSSFTGGAILSASGIAYLSMDSLAFSTSNERPTATSILLQGDAPLPNGAVFGQGVRCAGGTLKRMYVKTASGGSITAPDFSAGDPTISARLSALGTPIQPGQPYFYLVYYRDPIVLGGCSALATFNCTQTGSVSYWP